MTSVIGIVLGLLTWQFYDGGHYWAALICAFASGMWVAWPDKKGGKP